MKEAPLQKNQPFTVNWRGDILTFNALMTPHKSFENWLGSKRLRSSPILDEFYMESLEHNIAYISPPICTDGLFFGNGK